MKFNWKATLHTVAAAIIGGALTGAAQSIATGTTKGIGAATAAGALTGAAALWKKPPTA